MKKILSVALVSTAVFASAQISLAGKANMLFKVDSPSWQSIKGAAVSNVSDYGKNNVGFNVGLSARINLPASLFLMPELYYTTFKSEFNVPSSNTTLDVKSNRLDLPVLLGYRVLGDTFGLFIGPVASFNLAKENTYNDFVENAKNDFTVGYQFGAQVKLQKFLINGRYEGAFSKDQRDFISKVTSETFRYDSRPSLLMLGVGYEF